MCIEIDGEFPAVLRIATKSFQVPLESLDLLFNLPFLNCYPLLLAQRILGAVFDSVYHSSQGFCIHGSMWALVSRGGITTEALQIGLHNIGGSSLRIQRGHLIVQGLNLGLQRCFPRICRLGTCNVLCHDLANLNPGVSCNPEGLCGKAGRYIWND